MPLPGGGLADCPDGGLLTADPLRVGEVGQELLISGGEPESHCHEGDDTKMVSLTTLGSVIVECPGSLRVSV